MPKVGIEPVRKQQLIEATLKSIEANGFQGTTIVTISRLAGMSSGIISHYFGGKQGVIEAAVRHLLEQLQQGLLSRLNSRAEITPLERLMMVVETNFSGFQQSSPASSTWLSFWGQAIHDPDLARLQRVNQRRLESNLLYSFRRLIPDLARARETAGMTAAMIDGMWLRSTLSAPQDRNFREAERLCKEFIHLQVERFGHQSTGSNNG
ncbi:MAG: transcriptional regulator BetI [Oceanospirillaceae bacterium]|nr:transcriptional regulator BetI [Oceanospirillaceae bacterium]MBT14186.1 transcriptional regulator BetI [Oceanospirillaceae bacterium]|tara:strand:+ start:1726 stop:2349 length:624 start_codon:yes stop_codon:yes gene_type:complete